MFRVFSTCLIYTHALNRNFVHILKALNFSNVGVPPEPISLFCGSYHRKPKPALARHVMFVHDCYHACILFIALCACVQTHAYMHPINNVST